MSNPHVFYFGCWQEPGHYFWEPGPRYARNAEDIVPWGYTVDTKLCPPGPETEGASALHHQDGWTALAFWDRSVDQRPGSNSVFLAEGTHTQTEMMALAQEHFPQVLARLRPVVRKRLLPDAPAEEAWDDGGHIVERTP